MNRTFRNWLFSLHTWLGLHLSIFFTFMFLTGTVLVVGIEVESIARPEIWTTIAKEDRTASFAEIYDGIKTTHPESTVFVIEKYPAPWFADRTFGRTGWGENISFWTDPATGAVVYETRDGGFRDILRDLHDTFLTTKRPIFILISATSVLLLYQIVSGLITYRRFWKGFFRWPKRAGGFRSWSGATHRLTALWAAPLLILIAITSFYFMLGGLGFEGTTPKPQPTSARDTTLPIGFSSDTLEQAEASAVAALPGLEPLVMVLPGDPSGTFGFEGPVAGFAKTSGWGSVSVDPVTLEVLGAFTPDDTRGFARWKALMNTLHFGTWGGAVSLGLWVLSGLLATGVALTGALIFAARLAPEAAQYSPLRRIWRGLGMSRWIYLLILLGILLTAYQRFGPGSHQRAGVFPIDAPGAAAYLILSAPLRRDTPLDIEMHIGEAGITAASITTDREAAQPVELIQNGEKAQAFFRITPNDTANQITARLTKPDSADKIITFRLGQPIW
ncbi:PepSY domain-containing protein [Ruegeria sp. HKCCD6157]|uniref:PepSY-associated TM helix domain-containing protein n=1 Tax=Ruegeria sp. HKCCD6157 TaxID=2690707 RepID=UPI001493046B|nr:PepSY-associated TM helix domain-containing protein [Ruegeria sp. HKCCD6157]NOE28391.1 hypothetical protein [Ruegeria sp. HKCCD6157]